MTRPRRWIIRFVLAVVRRPRATLAITLALTGTALLLAWARLSISTDENKLFSDRVTFFHDFVQFDANFPENEATYVVVRARGDERAVPTARWTAAADAIATRLTAMPKVVKSAIARTPIDQVGAQGLLYDDPDDLRERLTKMRDLAQLAQVIGERPNPLMATLMGRTPLERLFTGLASQGHDDDVARFTRLVAESLTSTLQTKSEPALPDLAALEASDPRGLGYAFVPDELDRSRHLLLIPVHAVSDETALTAASESIEAIRAAVGEAAKDYPEFDVGVTGRPALSADEMRTTDVDSTKAEVVALSAVFIGVMLLLRSFWLAVASELALGVGIAWTLAWATVTRGELNLLSIVFFLALIGIGMDYLIQILSRYRVEAARRSSAQAIWLAVFKQVGPPINTACAGAAGAFLVSLLTDFAGAADLGLIAGGGLLLCLLAGYTFLPALLTVFPVRSRRKWATETQRHRGEGKTEIAKAQDDPTMERGPASFISSLCLRASVAHSSARLGPILWLVLLVAALPFAFRPRFNPSLLDLQADSLESVQLIRHLQSWEAVIVSKDLPALRAARATVLRSPRVSGTQSVLDAADNFDLLKRSPLPTIAWADPAPVAVNLVPALPARARALADGYAGATTQPTSADRAATAASLRAFADALDHAPSRDDAAKRLSAWQVGLIGELKEMMAAFAPATPADFASAPPALREHLIGRDGAYALYVYPKDDLWDQTKLDAFIADIEPRITALPQPVTLTGIAHNIHHSTAAIRGSFYKATGYALALIVLLVWIDLRRVGHTLAAISVLALGLPMLVGLMGLFGVDWNFANFFGLPILIGAGHEYGVFLVHRYREARRDPLRRAWGRWDVADRALLLCAFVTSSSFGFFWVFARHRGLKSLGLVMAVGSACIYLASVLALRPMLKARLHVKEKMKAEG